MTTTLRLSIALLALSAARAGAEVYQFSAQVAPFPGRNESPRAFLWIPPRCEKVRAVVFGHHNMEEEPLLAHPAFRKACADLGFAIVWVAPKFDQNFRFDQGAGEKFDAMLRSLAEASNYPELASVPVVAVGHSAAASMPWYMAMWKPERILTGISTSGQWPYVPDPQNAPQAEGRSMDAVPGLVTIGEYEWAGDRVRDGLKIRAEHPGTPISFLACPADGHFAPMDDKVDLLCLYLRKAAQYRLRDGGALAPIDPTKTGYLVDRWAANQSPRYPAAPVGSYAGPAAEAFWCFDEEHAKATEAFQARQRGKGTLVGYVQDGGVVPQKNGTHFQVPLAFQPEPDGVTFHLSGTFLDTVPEGRPEKWVGKKAGSPDERPDAPASAIAISRICGPIRQLDPTTFELSMNRTCYLGDGRDNEAWLVAVYPGDATFKRAVQQARMGIPKALTAGQPQTISFDPPATITADVPLAATSTSGLPVRFYVSAGPAEITGNNVLHITEVPARSAGKPISITVVAWQFGVRDRFRSAQPVERTVSLLPAKNTAP